MLHIQAKKRNSPNNPPPPNKQPLPQVSRRLARRLHHALETGQWGDVKLAAYSYAVLLERLPPETALLFAREVVVEAVVWLMVVCWGGGPTKW